jgi:hypothetical protein
LKRGRGADAGSVKADKKALFFIGGIILVVAPFCMYIRLFIEDAVKIPTTI